MLSYASQVLKTNTLPAARWVTYASVSNISSKCCRSISLVNQMIRWPDGQMAKHFDKASDIVAWTLSSKLFGHGYRPVGMAGAVSGAMAMPGPG